MFSRNMILQGRVAVDGYREAHKQLHSGGWYKGISEDHTPLLGVMLESLRRVGFNSLEEYFAAEKPYTDEFLRMDFEAQAIQREVRFIDLSQSSYVYNMAAQESIEALRTKGISPDTLLVSHSAIEAKPCIQIDRGSDTTKELYESEIYKAQMPVVRMLCSGWKPVFVSPLAPQPSLISRGIHDETTGLALWKEIMRQVWEHFGIVASCEGNDVLVDNKKVTGLWIGESIAQAVCSLDMDFTLADKVIPALAGASHDAQLSSERMTTAKIEAGRDIDFAEFFTVFKSVLETVLHLTFVPGHLTVAEEERIARYLPRYQSAKWTWQGEFNVH